MVVAKSGADSVFSGFFISSDFFLTNQGWKPVFTKTGTGLDSRSHGCGSKQVAVTVRPSRIEFELSRIV